MEGVEPEGVGPEDEAEGVEPIDEEAEPGVDGGREVSRQRSWQSVLRSVIAERVKVLSWSRPSRFCSTRTSTSLSHSYNKKEEKNNVCYNQSKKTIEHIVCIANRLMSINSWLSVTRIFTMVYVQVL